MTVFIIRHEGVLSNEPAWKSEDVEADSEGQAIYKLEARMGRKLGNFTIKERLTLKSDINQLDESSSRKFLTE